MGREYRNYYAADPGDPKLEALVAKGDTVRAHEIPGGLVYYHVTPQGRRRAYADVGRPSLSRSEKRYRRFIEADSGMTFGEWLRSEKQRSMAQNKGGAK